jgi:penicillin-binding protein 2
LILDRAGTVLVGNRVVYEIEIDRAELPRAPARATELRLLGRELGLPDAPGRCRIPKLGLLVLPQIACRVEQAQALGIRTVQVATAQSERVVLALTVGAHRGELPGVSIIRAQSRTYPQRTIGAQLFGTAGPVTPSEAGQRRLAGVPQSAIVGESGLEYQYDAALRAGQNLRLSIDLPLEKVGQTALAESIGRNDGDGGAFVALDPTNGQVLAMGSNPTYDPSVFAQSFIPQAQYDALTDTASNYPLLNRAIQSAGPTGSTFKPITATAALESGDWLVGDTYDDTGEFCFSVGGLCLHNSGHAAYGVVNLVTALKVSDDVFFYNLGAATNADPDTHPNGGPLEQWARRFGIGQPTGIDLPDATTGLLPTPNLLKELYQEELQCEHGTGLYAGDPKHPASQGGCGIASNPYWTVGDNVNTGVGQGDVQVSPLQLAVVYAALANGGTIVTPHVGLDVQSADGTVLQKIDPAPQRHLNINPLYLDTIREGLREAASEPGGTSDDVMGNFPEQVYGKTGTAEYNGQNDYAWYACFVPASATSKPIVVVAWVEQGGFGDVAAAPVARQILSQWFLGHPGPYVSGTSTTL